MAGPIIYLDVDDEITTAAARIRALDAGRVAVVVPAGSRIATSRMNFRLLAREAAAAGKDLAIVAPDAASRALAASAGLTTFASVGDFEGPAPSGSVAPVAPGSADAPDEDRAAGAATAGAAAVGAMAAGAATSGAAGSGAPPAVPPAGHPSGGSAPPGGSGVPAAPPGATEIRSRSAGAGPRPQAAGRRGGRTIATVAIIAVLAVGALVVGAVAGYLLLPAATVTVTPAVSTVGPIQLTVRADPAATTVDVGAGVVPAQRISLEVTAQGSYEATGERVEETAASGSVTFTNCNFLAATEIKAGSRVSTEAGVRFTTDETIVVPAANFAPPNSLTCSTRNVGVTAAAAGPAGNVPAGAIKVVPGDQNPRAVQVTNQAPTTGGARETFPVVTEADVTRAREDLGIKLGESFTVALADPAAAPADTTLFPETASLGEASYEPDPAGFIGQEIASFELSVRATGEVTVADTSAVTEVAEDRLADAVDPDQDLVAGSVTVVVGDPVVVGAVVEFPVRASGQQIAQLDPAELEPLVLGKTPEEAIAALVPYGVAVVELTPDWAATIPTYDFRVEVVIVGQEPEADPGDGGSTPSPGS